MYLITSTKGKYVFTLLESCIDFILQDDFYVYNSPTIYRQNMNKFDEFMTITYRGVESGYHMEDKPAHCDASTFDLWDAERMQYIKAGWVDDYQDGLDMRKVIRERGMEIEGEVWK